MKNILISILLLIVFLSCKENSRPKDYLNLEPKLSGKWIAKAFDGELHEEWILNTDGWMHQTGYYIENADTSYSARTKIEKVGNDVILFSVIKDSNPKIFKALTKSDNEIIFENDDYRNPYEVRYEFLSDSSYRRTIVGYERDSSLVIYEFDFVKVQDQVN